jgi:hypothetical protein
MVDATNHPRNVRLRSRARLESADDVDGLESFLPEADVTALSVPAAHSLDLTPPVPMRVRRPLHQPRLHIRIRRSWWKAAIKRRPRVFPRLSASGRRATPIVIVTAALVSVAAGQLRVNAPLSAVRSVAIAGELPTLAPFAAPPSMIAAVHARARAMAGAVPTITGDAADQRAIQAALNGYRDALSRLDAQAVASVWQRSTTRTSSSTPAASRSMR